MPISEEMGQAFYNKAEVQKTGAIRYLDEALEAAIAASPSDAERHERATPVAWLRHGESVPVQGVPFGAMWITDKDDPRGFPVYAAPPAAVQEPVAVKSIEDEIMDAIDEYRENTPGNTYGKYGWPTIEGIKDAVRKGIRSALSSPVQGRTENEETAAAIALGAAVLTRIADPAVREIAIHNALTEASKATSSARSEGRIYDPSALMADGSEDRMTAAEEVLAYLLIEVTGSPDDVPYSPNEAQRILEDRLKEGRRLETDYAEFLNQRRATLQQQGEGK
ncbi:MULTISPECIES: hypothetical protein [unclassified Rhizobium]|uniref:hypothetical protein n=1 Tax=unclassified Rhizobium TaxID=2613769 RepID=UPI00382F7E3B